MPGLGDESREAALVMPLRMLLGAATGAMLVGAAGFLFWELAAGTARGAAGLFATVLVLAGALVALLITEDLTVPLLRRIETTVFGVVALYLAWRAFASLVDPVTAADPAAVASRWNLTLLQFVLLMVAYGTLVPNTWHRAARGVGLLAAVPLTVAGLVSAGPAAAASSISGIATRGKIAESIAMLLVAATIAIAAAHVIDQYLSLARTTRITLRYMLKRRIGIGGMGEVWLGEHNLLARPAAVKLIRRDTIDNRHADKADLVLRRFEREARATAALRSSHTVEVYDYGVADDGIFYYAMEYLEGIDLSTLVEQHGAIPAERVVYLLTQTCQSLADAHARGLTHRDIKPANIFTCRMGTAHDFVKVLDFGLVGGNAIPGVQDEGATDLTLEGEIKGTPGYMAPEMIRHGQPIDGRADIYALGCVGYYLLTGSPLFEGPPLSVLVDHVKTTPTPPSARTDLPIPPGLEQVILRCLAKAPADRYRSASELADALEANGPEPRWNAQRAAEWWDLHLPAQRQAS